jgi:hypothetical protein
MILVAAQADESAERIVDYLSSKANLQIEVVTFTYATLGDGQEILARSIITPDPPTPALTKPAAKITRDELFGVAEERQVLGFVETLNKVTELGWFVEMFSISGGQIRYWVKLPADDTWRVLFGMYVGGEKFSTPRAQLDIWVRPKIVVQFSGVTIESVVGELRRFEIVNETNTAIVLRLKDQQAVSALDALLHMWITKSTELATRLQQQAESSPS